jgi:hypothetical protein
MLLPKVEARTQSSATDPRKIAYLFDFRDAWRDFLVSRFEFELDGLLMPPLG